MQTVGIDAMSFYSSNYFLNMATLAEGRGLPVSKFHEGLGQYQMAVFPPDEDIVSMGANAARQVLKKVDPKTIDMLLFATESGIDQSKSAGIFVHQLLGLPKQCRVLELKQACYSATAGIQLALPYLQQNPDRSVLLIASDIAKYGLGSSGESSQGGGAVAMVLTANPRVLAIEPEAGYHTEDVMDFWRPNYRDEALVDGKYSCELYLKLIKKTWQSYSEKSKRTFDDHQHFLFHVPVPRLVEKGLQMLRRTVGLPKLSEEALGETMHTALNYGRQLGNCYTAALYLSLISLLENTEEDLAHHRVGLYSYGSGCVAEFYSGVIQPGYQEGLDKSYHHTLLKQRKALSLEEYEHFYQYPFPMDGGQHEMPQQERENAFRLSKVAHHKRIYEAMEES